MIDKISDDMRSLAKLRSDRDAYWEKIRRIEDSMEFQNILERNFAEIYTAMTDLLAAVDDFDYDSLPDRRTRGLFEAMNNCDTLIYRLRNNVKGEY